MNHIVKQSLLLMGGIALTSSLAWKSCANKKPHPRNIQGIYKVHETVIATSDGNPGWEGDRMVSVPSNTIDATPMFDWHCYAGACQTDLPNHKVSYGEVVSVGTISTGWTGFTSTYTQSWCNKDNTCHWITAEDSWTKVSD
jgi:hypothetical protein